MCAQLAVGEPAVPVYVRQQIRTPGLLAERLQNRPLVGLAAGLHVHLIDPVMRLEAVAGMSAAGERAREDGHLAERFLAVLGKRAMENLAVPPELFRAQILRAVALGR